MKRRQALRQLLYASGGVIMAVFLPGCNQPVVQDPQVLLSLFDPAKPLPAHWLTQIEEFYVQSYALPPQVDAQKWRLEIAGAVNQPLQLTYQDILEAPQEDFYLTMECIGNPAGGNLIGNAAWRGTSLLPFLERAGIKPEATEFVMHGADSYETTLPIAELLRPDVRLVHQMNQAPLTREHGYPVRIIIPGYFGQKQPKWLVKLEAIANPKRGYWERQGWSNTARIPTHSLTRQVQEKHISNRSHHVVLQRQGELGWEKGILLVGVALDQSTAIRQIKVSTDDGKTWQTAERNQPPSPHEWTLWRYVWRPETPGKYTVLAIAESERQQQPIDDSHSRDGSAGALKIQVTLAT